MRTTARSVWVKVARHSAADLKSIVLRKKETFAPRTELANAGFIDAASSACSNAFFAATKSPTRSRLLHNWVNLTVRCGELGPRHSIARRFNAMRSMGRL